jgi:hypothetical protein
MVTGSEADFVSLHTQLRDAADMINGKVYDSVTRLIRDAAAEIEGHNEAFAAVVDQKRDLAIELRSSQTNHRHTLDFIARWRELLVQLECEQPDDIRIKRALAGEHPMRPAPWERN